MEFPEPSLRGTDGNLRPGAPEPPPIPEHRSGNPALCFLKLRLLGNTHIGGFHVKSSLLSYLEQF